MKRPPETLTGETGWKRAAVADANAHRETLRRIWTLSQHDRMPIWIAGEMQDIVIGALHVEGAYEAVALLFPEEGRP